MKNRLTDLNDLLFAQLERLGDESLSGEELKQEIDRSKACSSLAKELVNNARLVLDAQQYADDSGRGSTQMPEVFQPHQRLTQVQ